MQKWFGGLFAFSLLVFSTVGCGSSGPELGTVTGKVTMDGKPLGSVLVTFVPKVGGRESRGTTDPGGNYKLLFLDREGALIGAHKVSVISIPASGTVKEMSSDDPEYQKQALGTGSAETSAPPVETIPPRYNRNTELVKEVKSGPNIIDLELKSG